MPSNFDVLAGYWQVGEDQTQVWFSGSLNYVLTSDPTYQIYLTNGGTTIQISDTNSLFQVMANQVIPNYLSSGIQIQCTSNPSVNSTYPLDSVSVGLVGNIARDSGSGLSLPLGEATVPILDIFGNFQLFTAPQVQNLYMAERDYIVSVNNAIFNLINSIPTPGLPVNTTVIN